MSKNNSEKIESELEASNVFTLKGEDETQIEQSAKIEIETNKKFQEPPDSQNEIIITNLSNYSFGIPEHEYSSENGEFNEPKKDLIGNFKKNKNSIIPKERKYDSVVKIKFTKNNRGKIIKVLRKGSIDPKVINNNMNINDKEIDNLLEVTNTNIENNDEPSEGNKMELEHEEKKEEKIFHAEESIQDEIENSISEHAEFDKKVKEDFDTNISHEVNNIKDNSSDMIIEPDNSDEHEKENEKDNEKELYNINGGISENVLNDISKLTLENGLNKVIKEQLENKNNTNINKEDREDKEDKKEEENILEENAEIIIKENDEKNMAKEVKEKKKSINSKKYNNEEKKIMANEDINMKDKSKKKDKEKTQEDKNENNNEKKHDEKQSQIGNLCEEEECNKKNEIGQNVANVNESNSKEDVVDDIIIEVKKDDEDIKEKDKLISNKEDSNNINDKKVNKIEENDNKKEEKENKLEEKKIKDVKNEESNKIQSNNNIFQNLNNIDIEKMITEKLSEALNDFLKDKKNNIQSLFNSKETSNSQIEQNKNEKVPDDKFLGKKREKTFSNSLDRPKKSNSLENKEVKLYNKSDININEDSSLGKLLEKHIFNYLYEKIMTKSLSNESDLEKKINNFIREKGYSKVKSSLINVKKEKEKKENLEPSVQKMKELDEIHYLFINNFYHRFKSIKTKDGFQTYICCDKECKGLAKLNIKERKFEILQSHTVSLKDHLHFNDDRPVFFMKSRKLDEVHIKRNEHNDKYHLEWFN